MFCLFNELCNKLEIYKKRCQLDESNNGRTNYFSILLHTQEKYSAC